MHNDQIEVTWLVGREQTLSTPPPSQLSELVAAIEQKWPRNLPYHTYWVLRDFGRKSTLVARSVSKYWFDEDSRVELPVLDDGLVVFGDDRIDLSNCFT